MKTFKAFIKPFQTPQRSVKIKIKVIFILIHLSEMNGVGRVNLRKNVVLSNLDSSNLRFFLILMNDLPDTLLSNTKPFAGNDLLYRS